MTGSAPCPCCAGEAADMGPLAPGTSFAGRILDAPLPGGHLYACPTCHLRFRAPRPSAEQLAALYNAGGTGQWQYDLADRADWHLALPYLRERPVGTLLDIGCFDGAFLSLAPDGWKRLGVEIGDAYAREAQRRGVEIVGADATRLDGVTSVDVITAFDLVEHLPDPLALLTEWRRALAPDGLIVIGTGDASAPSWRFMGSRYWYCAIAEHLAFISPEWCAWAAPRAGLELVATHRYSHAPQASAVERARQAAFNVLHRVAPPVFRSLSRLRRPEVASGRVEGADEVPALWMSAHDHVLAVFRAAP